MKFGIETPPGKGQEPTDKSRREFLKAVGGLTAFALAGAGAEENAEGAQNLLENKFRCKGGKCEFMFTSPNSKEAHDYSANKFEKEVGDALKDAYPSKILDPNVILQILRINGQKLYRLYWSCRIVKAKPSEADYYFDRRGTMLPGPTLPAAKAVVEAELKSSDKVEAMRKAWEAKGKKGKIYDTFIKDSSAGSDSTGYWYIKEFFLVAPK